MLKDVCELAWSFVSHNEILSFLGVPQEFSLCILFSWYCRTFDEFYRPSDDRSIRIRQRSLLIDRPSVQGSSRSRKEAESGKSLQLD